MPVSSLRSRARRTHLSLQSLEGRDVPNGTITAVLSPTTGLLTITGDDDDNVVSLKLTTGANPSVSLTPDANTTIGTAALGAQVTLPGIVKSMKVDLKGGADDLSIDTTSDFVVSGTVTIGLGDGNNTLALATTGRIGLGGLTVTGGDGFDDVTISGGAASTIGGTAKLSYGNGGSNTALTGVTFSSLTLTAGEAAGDGIINPTNDVAGTNVTVSKTFSAALANAFPAALDFSGSTIGTLKASGYSVVSNLQNSTIKAGITYKTTASLDVEGDGLTVTGNVALTAPNATFGGTAGAIVLNGNLSLTGSAQTTTSFLTTAASEVKGNITVKGGWFNDVFETNANFKADKNVSLTLNGGNNSVSIGDGTGTAALIGGKVMIKTGNGNDFISFDEATVTGSTAIAAMGGADLLSIEDGTKFSGTFSADMGVGDDTISIAQNTGVPGPPPVPGPVTFTGKAKIVAGAGNDTLFLGVAVALGGDATSAVVFTDSTSTLDGGLGLNSFDALSAQFSPAGLTFLNW
jgi:hypothetical protein